MLTAVIPTPSPAMSQIGRIGPVFEMNVTIFQKQISLQSRISLAFLFVSLVGCAGSLPLEGQITNIEIQYNSQAEAVFKKEFAYKVECQNNECIGTGSCSKLYMEENKLTSVELEPLIIPNKTIRDISESLINVNRVFKNDDRLDSIPPVDSKEWNQTTITTDLAEQITLESIGIGWWGSSDTSWVISTKRGTFLQETNEFASAFNKLIDEPLRTCSREIWNKID